MRESAIVLAVAVHILAHGGMGHAKITRGNGSPPKTTNFHKSPVSGPEAELPRANERNIIAVMQNVLCKNFPEIPCHMIVQDRKLKRLINMSIKEINNKMPPSTPPAPPAAPATTRRPRHLHTTHHHAPRTADTDDLSPSLSEAREKGYFHKNPEHDRKGKRRKQQQTEASEDEHLSKRLPKTTTKTKAFRRKLYTGSRRLTKFFPHKVKYKETSAERRSASQESLFEDHERLPLKADPADPPVWKIDYMKHGEPSLDRFQSGQLQGKVVKKGPNVIVDENALEHAARKDIMHADVYIKKGIVRGASGEIAAVSEGD